MTHEKKMELAWSFIREGNITDDPELYEQGPDTYWLVDNVHEVRDAYYDDLEAEEEYDEDLSQFFDRHGIEYR